MRKMNEASRPKKFKEPAPALPSVPFYLAVFPSIFLSGRLCVHGPLWCSLPRETINKVFPILAPENLEETFKKGFLGCVHAFPDPVCLGGGSGFASPVSNSCRTSLESVPNASCIRLEPIPDQPWTVRN